MQMSITFEKIFCVLRKIDELYKEKIQLSKQWLLHFITRAIVIMIFLKSLNKLSNFDLIQNYTLHLMPPSHTFLQYNLCVSMRQATLEGLHHNRIKLLQGYQQQPQQYLCRRQD